MQVGAVGIQTGAQAYGQARRQVAPIGGGAEQENAGLALHQSLEGHPGVGVDRKMLQQGMFRQPEAIGAVGEGLLRQVSHLVPQQQPGKLPAHEIGHLAPLAQQLQRDVLQNAGLLFKVNPDLFTLFRLAVKG